MTYRLPPIQPLWSFASPTHLRPPHGVAPDQHIATVAAVQGWATGPDGRPRVRWSLSQRGRADA